MTVITDYTEVEFTQMGITFEDKRIPVVQCTPEVVSTVLALSERIEGLKDTIRTLLDEDDSEDEDEYV